MGFASGNWSRRAKYGRPSSRWTASPSSTSPATSAFWPKPPLVGDVDVEPVVGRVGRDLERRFAGDAGHPREVALEVAGFDQLLDTDGPHRRDALGAGVGVGHLAA